MSGYSTLGVITPPAIFLTVEIHKLHLAFKVGTDVKAGQPVKLNSDGTIAPIVAGTDSRDLMIGIALRDTPAVDLSGGLQPEATIIMRGYATLQAISGAAVVIGPVKYSGYDATNLRVKFATATVGTDDVYGHCLDGAAGTGTIIEVVVLP